MEDPESEINIQRLLRLKRVFEEADEDGSGELDIDEFIEKVGPHLGDDLTKTQLTQLFMKIDADAGGTVDWDEFTSFMFLQQCDPDTDGNAEWRFFPQEYGRRIDNSCNHRSEISHVLHVEQSEKYVTTGHDGTFRIWNTSDLSHLKTMSLSPVAWATASVYLPRSRHIAIASTDGVISFCGIVRGSYDIVGRIATRRFIGIPHCLCCLEAEGEEYVVCGDDEGHVAILLSEVDSSSHTTTATTHSENTFEVLHRHDDWVTQVRDVHDVGLVSSSLDATVRIYDVARGRLTQTYRQHRRGVHCFEWCTAYSLFASGGVERSIVLWQPATNARKIGELIGHSSSLTQLAIDEKTNQVISLSLDRTVKVWDLRNHRCLQTIAPEDWPKDVDRQPTCMAYDRKHRRLLTCSQRIDIWPHKLTSQDKSGHQYPVIETIYNSTFHLVVSTDEEGVVCVWNVDNGCRESKFCAKDCHQAKLTAATFDSNQRRLLTAASDGAVKMWNFNSGKLLRQYIHGAKDVEITTVMFVHNRTNGCDQIIAAGWRSKIFLWEDVDEDEVFEHKTLNGHQEDILHMSICSEKDLMATGDYQGRIVIWKPSTGAKRETLWHEAIRYETAVNRLAWLLTRSRKTGGELLLLLSAGGDGTVRVWNISQHSALIATIQGGLGQLEQVSALITRHDVLVVGDTAGHVKILDVTKGIDLTSTITIDASFSQIAHWQAHDGRVTGLDFIPLKDNTLLLLTCSTDTRVALWTLQGGLVGEFGKDSWNLNDQSSWKDADGIQSRPPQFDLDSSFIEDFKGEPQAATRTADPKLLLELELSRKNRSPQAKEDYASKRRLETHPLGKLPKEVDSLLVLRD